MKNISNEAFFALIDAKSIEEFLVTKELLNLRGKFNEKDSREIVTTFIVNHKDVLIDELANLGMFNVGHEFASKNFTESFGRQQYINDGMEWFMCRHSER